MTRAEEQELDQYEELDDYLSYQNRMARNLVERHPPQSDPVQQM